jgi:sigma-E factor negative regulatory protein RseC
MVEEQAVVVDLKDEMAMLEVIRRKPCGLCGQTRGCGVSMWGKLFRHRPNVFKALNRIDAKVGDFVIVGVEEQALLRSSLLVYGVPLLALLAGAMFASLAWGGEHRDASAVLGAVLGLAVGLLWVRGHTAGRTFDSRYQPVILRADNKIVIN